MSVSLVVFGVSINFSLNCKNYCREKCILSAYEIRKGGWWKEVYFSILCVISNAMKGLKWNIIFSYTENIMASAKKKINKWKIQSQ